MARAQALDYDATFFTAHGATPPLRSAAPIAHLAPSRKSQVMDSDPAWVRDKAYHPARLVDGRCAAALLLASMSMLRLTFTMRTASLRSSFALHGRFTRESTCPLLPGTGAQALLLLHHGCTASVRRQSCSHVEGPTDEHQRLSLFA